MDFARKQLEKYGWTAGKGLGKNENGISEALKPKLKRSVTGVGHDLASDFTEHWWSDLYNKAAKNVEVEEVNGKVKKIKSKEAAFEITNNTWQIKKKRKGDDSTEEQYTDYFVRTAILSNGASKTENINTSESEGEGLAMDIVKITDEELFAACEGRTAHKGARHGLKALGKLARIEQQEQMLLNQTKYNGYSNKSEQNAKKIENSNSQEKFNKFCDIDQVAAKKKKKKQSYDEICSVNTATDFIDQLNENFENKTLGLHKKNKDKRKNDNDFPIENNISEEVENNVPRKKKKANLDAASISCETDALDLQENNGKDMSDLKKKKKDKRKLHVKLSVESNISTEIKNNISRKKKSFQVECTTSETNEENIVNIQKESDNILIKKKKKKKKNCKDM